MSLLSMYLNNTTDINKLMYSYDAHFAVKCYKTGCSCLDAFHVLKYACTGTKALGLGGGVKGISCETTVTCKQRVTQSK